MIGYELTAWDWVIMAAIIGFAMMLASVWNMGDE